jgi:integrase
MINGRKYRGSTKEASKGRAQQYENALIGKVREEGAGAILRRSPTLAAYAKLFLAQCELEVAAHNLSVETWKYYRAGCRLLADTSIALMRLNSITRKDAAALQFPGGPSNANCAFRTLRRMLNLAVEDNVLKSAPRIRTLEETGRNALIEPWIEKRLLAHADPLLFDIVVIMADTGMRPGEVLALRWPDIFWERQTISIPKSKASRRNGGRFVPCSERAMSAFTRRRNAAESEWVFPGRSKSGHRTTVKQLWLKCVKAANADGGPSLPADLVLYCGRHTFATDLLDATKNLKLVQDTLGHADIRTTMKYLHPSVADAADVINARNRRREMKVVSNG